ncbi:MAG TPA: NAD(P)-binding domain-containing protein [Polyangiales bacterium]|nr:NAD(P)-binding domain-containing protein [Polyangiales bacterium]
MTDSSTLPVVVIGAGPSGLAAAAHLMTRGLPFLVLEASADVSASFRSTSHVRLFSPWTMNVDGAAARVLEAHGWRPPDPDAKPTAGELCSQYLQPLARALAPHVRFNARVLSISRRGFDKVKSAGREQANFVLHTLLDGRHEELEAKAVIDASGTWATPNPMGANGLPARGEAEHAARIRYGMPDVAGSEQARYANKHVLVLGSGHSAAGSLIGLAALAEKAPRTRISWAIRSSTAQRIFGGGAKDGLPERGALGTRLRQLTERGSLQLISDFHVEAVSGDRVSGRTSEGARHTISGIDEIIVATGARPDWSLARELRLRLDPWLESTEQLAPLIDPNVHSCGSVPPHGHRELSHPEVGYYAIGAKSYGRAPNFLMATGHEQARSVVAALAGDLAAADDVQLVLPETGVCSADFVEPTATSACCGPAPKQAGCCGPSGKSQPIAKASGCCG